MNESLRGAAVASELHASNMSVEPLWKDPVELQVLTEAERSDAVKI